MEGTRVLVVEDDPVIGGHISSHLSERLGVHVALASTLAGASDLLAGTELVVLDLALPDSGAEETLQRIRALAPAALVIVVTALGSVADRVRGLRGGADDYLAKPFSLLELEARVEALLRRRGAPDPAVHSHLYWDKEARALRRGGEALPLTPLEYEVFCALAARPGRALSREELLKEVLGPNFYGYERVIDVHVGHLRKKLDPEDSFRYVATVRHYGYRWDGPDLRGEVRLDPA